MTTDPWDESVLVGPQSFPRLGLCRCDECQLNSVFRRRFADAMMRSFEAKLFGPADAPLVVHAEPPPGDPEE